MVPTDTLLAVAVGRSYGPAVDMRKKVSPEHAARIIRAMEGIPAAVAERDAAITAALKADASVREVAACSGMSTASVQKIGRENGWPTAAQKKRREDEQAERERFNEYIAAYRAEHPELEQP